MQRNHSHRAASLVKPLRSVPSVPSQPPSSHLTPPPKIHSLTATRGEEKGTCVPTRLTGSTNHRDPHRHHHMGICFKNNKRKITMTDKYDDSCTDATGQTGSSPLCSVGAKPPWLSKATGSTKRAFSLLLYTLLSILRFIMSNVLCLVYFLDFLIVLTSDISSVLNCPALGEHYFHNLYFFILF